MTTKEITIGGAIVTITTPYEEGHAVNAAEAKALNQVRAENIANNCRKFVSDRKQDDNTFSDEHLGEIASHVAAYDDGYEFTLASVGGGRKPVDPLEKECYRAAKEWVTAKIKEAGKLVKDYDKEKMAEMVAGVAENATIISNAKATLKAKSKLAGIELAGITDIADEAEAAE